MWNALKSNSMIFECYWMRKLSCEIFKKLNFDNSRETKINHRTKSRWSVAFKWQGLMLRVNALSNIQNYIRKKSRIS